MRGVNDSQKPDWRLASFVEEGRSKGEEMG